MQEQEVAFPLIGKDTRLLRLFASYYYAQSTKHQNKVNKYIAFVKLSDIVSVNMNVKIWLYQRRAKNLNIKIAGVDAEIEFWDRQLSNSGEISSYFHDHQSEIIRKSASLKEELRQIMYG